MTWAAAKDLRPSAAAIWQVCHGYAAMLRAYPQPEGDLEADNEVREDGTACHWLAEEMWHGRQHEVGALSPNNRTITEEMHDAVAMYHEALRAPNRGWDMEWHIEAPVDCAWFVPGMKGTADAWGHKPGWLRVVDLKYGFAFVEVWENPQLIVYGHSIATQLAMGDDDMVEFTIVQPRSYHRDGQVRTWHINVGELRKLAEPLRAAAHAALVPGAKCTPNPGCFHCPARHVCVALQQSAIRAMEQSYASVPFELEPAAVAGELTRLKTAAKHMEGRITGLTAQAEAMLRNGTVVPGWDIQQGVGRTRWLDGCQEKLLALGDYFGVDIAAPRVPVSPTKAKTLLPEKVIGMYTHRPSTGVKLVKQDKFAAAKAFSNQEKL